QAVAQDLAGDDVDFRLPHFLLPFVLVHHGHVGGDDRHGLGPVNDIHRIISPCPGIYRPRRSRAQYAPSPGNPGRRSSSASRTNPGRSFRPASTTRRFSAGSMLHVEYTTTPPGRTRSAARISNRVCSAANSPTSSARSRQRISGRLPSTPVLLHGTSTSAASN